MVQPSAIERNLSLETLPRHQHARIAGVDWARLGGLEGRRLRELGVDEGVEVEVLHRSPVGRGPIACRIGRMTIAIRRPVASAVCVSLT